VPISAHQELLDAGQFGPVGLDLLFKLMGQECRRFPALRPAQAWDSDAVWDLVQDFFTDRGARVTTMLLAQAGDDASMARLLRRSIRNYLIDRIRGTDLGALRRRLEELLAEEPSFERVPQGEAGAGRWRLAGTAGEPWSGRLQDLVTVAYAVPGVRRVRWTSGSRRSPLAERTSLVAIAEAVLGAAGGSLAVSQLVAVFAQRFPAAVDLGDAPMSQEVEATATAPAEDRPDAQVVAAEQEWEAAEQALAIFEQLAARERLLLPYLDKTTDEQAGVLGCGRSQANLHANRLKEALRRLLEPLEDRDEVMLELWRLCKAAT
jgi:DNA-directed RNA polymerase specialized sigma24 family protein